MSKCHIVGNYVTAHMPDDGSSTSISEQNILLGQLPVLFVCFFVPFDALCPSQQFFSHVRTNSYLPGLNQY